MDANSIPVPSVKEKPETEKPKSIRIPSEGQKFSLLGTKYRVTKSKGFKFTAEAVEE